ncbi:FG-GAP-like repeat-containing protein [Streptomyces sp. NBC_01304]|uniref:FG-GAP-like repeat-containing protein n=1 Tax=Streptomyces sp. NBC_01304 TaxID=2903818 RepID=UPI002E15B2B2|nr:FG-GAP-like repeat-containing protein [Streptomyces sp. NBC_01304]
MTRRPVTRRPARRAVRRRAVVAVAFSTLLAGLLGGAIEAAPSAQAAATVPSWVIPLYYDDEATGTHRACTGVVLSKTRTLATPDCFTGMGTGDFEWEYNLGTGQLAGGGEQVAYRSHPKYDATSRYAAVTVANRRTPDNSGKPVLATGSDSALWAAGAKATFHSWAGLDADNAPRVRHSEQVVVKSAAQCAELLGGALPGGTLCTAPAPGAPPVADDDQCFGDAGGALVAGGRLVAVSATQATGCVRGGVRVYTKVASYRPLIDEWTRGVDTHYRDAGSILAKEPNDLVDVCSTDVRRKLEGCGVDDTGSFDGTGYNTLLQAGDMNGDGFGDLLARTSGGTLYRVPSRDFELADFDHRVRIGGGWDAYSRLVAVRDISGDGRGDLVARDGSGVLWLYRGTSDGKFAARARIGGGWGTYNTLAGRGDLSGDGRSDLVARDGSGVLWLYRGNGRGGFEPRKKIGGGWGRYNAIVASGDMDHNGRQDILARTPGGAAYLYNADHTGGFATPKQLAETRLKRYSRIS